MSRVNPKVSGLTDIAMWHYFGSIGTRAVRISGVSLHNYLGETNLQSFLIHHHHFYRRIENK